MALSEFFIPVDLSKYINEVLTFTGFDSKCLQELFVKISDFNQGVLKIVFSPNLE